MSRRSVGVYVLAAAMYALLGVRASEARAQWYYYFFDERRPLALDLERVAIDSTGQGAPIPAAPGIIEESIEAWPIGEWLMAPTQADARTPDDIRDLVAQLAAAPDVNFVSPVFVGDDGGPIIITPDLLVGFRSDVDPASAQAILAVSDAGVIVERDWAKMHGVYRLHSASKNGFEVLEAANRLARRPEVEFAEPDVIFTGRGDFIPNDPGFPDLWGLQNIGQFGGVVDMDMDVPEAWDISTGDPSIIVVIIDSGVQQDHPDINQIPGTDVTSDASTDGGPVNQFDNHGTAVAGCVSAIINNNLGTVGVAPTCNSASARTFIAINEFGMATSQVSWTVQTLNWAESIGARVTNNSYSYGFYSSAIAAKYAASRDRGVVHFASAGNAASSGLAFPASLPTVNALAALDPDGTLAYFSSYGQGLAFAAPGVAIFTTDRTGTDGYSSGDFVFTGGTSFSSPYAAGVAALVLSVDPALSAVDVEVLLQETSVDLGMPGYDIVFGWGLLNAQAALGDCNGNGIPDDQDVTAGTSEDCNENEVPDECESDADCNGNGVQDACDLAIGTSEDCNGNWVPDECDPDEDCNDNGVQDICDVAVGTSPDCNNNGVPDSCDISSGTSHDCDENAMPDECDPDQDCNGNGVQDVCDVAAQTSPDCNDNHVPDECDVSCGGPVGSCPGEGDCCDPAGNGTPGCDCSRCCHAVCSLDSFCCEIMWDSFCAYVATMEPECDCAASSIWSSDCNGNDVPDECDIADATSQDCNGNEVPDECEADDDCNNNGVQDICDVAAATSPDCNSNGVPDECDLDIGVSEDCNSNEVPDECEPDEDCNGNEVPDECEPYADCNGNGVQDICDIAVQTSRDCNSNEVPDECDLAIGVSEDCNGNEVPDVCEPDEDCNGNDVQDICDIAVQTSEDCNGNDVPDECEPVALYDNGPLITHPGAGPDGAHMSLLQNETLGMSTSGFANQAALGYRVADDFIVADPEGRHIDTITFFAYQVGSSTISTITSVNLRIWDGSPYWPWSTVVFGDTTTDRLVSSTWSGIYRSSESGGLENTERPIMANVVAVDTLLGPGTYWLDWSTDGTLASGPWVPPVTIIGETTTGDALQYWQGEWYTVFDSGSFTQGLPFIIVPFGDCNDNGRPDDCDITDGTSENCNANSLPDECESDADCNGNGVQDICDLADGSSEDCNGNEVPDECEPDEDCNGNGIQDICDVPLGHSPDCNGNRLPDECEPDCNGNDVPDDCDAVDVTIGDCNLNGVPDECDIADGVGGDCNDNGVPDECDLGADNSEAADNCTDAPPVCPGITYLDRTSGATNDGTATCGWYDDSPDVWYRYTPTADGTLIVWLCGSSYDTVLSVHRGCPGDAAHEVACNDDYCGFQSGLEMPVTAGVTYWIRVSGYFSSVGTFTLMLAGPDCPPMSYDCNNNTIPDECDVASGSSQDCNGNYVPDECDPECNDNDVPDECDIAAGTSVDCNANNVPDECESNEITFTSPQLSPIGKGWPQSFVIPDPPEALTDVTLTFTASADLDAGTERIAVLINGMIAGAVFDEPDQYADCPLEPDTDRVIIPASTFNNVSAVGEAVIEMNPSDGVFAFQCTPTSYISVEVRYGTVPDCNATGALDACDIAAGTSYDCNQNGMPDECEADCNENGIADECEPDEDCNGNDVQDICDLAVQTSQDCNVNSIPDECEADGDRDGVIDSCDPCPFDMLDDRDGDGSCDSDEQCPNDPHKTEPGECGCGVSDDDDTDGDGIPDCNDECHGVDDAVFAPECTGVIPTVSGWGLTIMVLVLLAAAKIGFGRRPAHT